MKIDWRRMSCPTEDGYDTDMIVRLGRDLPPLRDHRDRDHATGIEGLVADGRVAVAVDDDPLLQPPRYRPVRGIPEGLTAAIARVARWPAAAAQWPRITHRIQAYTDTAWQEPPLAGQRPLGSSSHNRATRFGVIGLTIDCAVGAAQSIVHETAHHKLRAMGVDNEAATRIICNPPDQLFMSPVVGCPRPMTALLHAQYAFIHVLQLDLNMLRAEPDPARRRDILTLTDTMTPLMIAGAEIIRSDAQLDAAGEAFMDGFMIWSDAVLRAATMAVTELTVDVLGSPHAAGTAA